LYQKKRALICTAASSPKELFETSQRENLSEWAEDDAILGIDQVQNSQGHAISELASVRELSFAFQRCASRLVEMTSLKWWLLQMT
jgi:predicted ATPase